MSSSRASARSRLAFGAVLALLFAGSFGGAYAFRQRQLDTSAKPIDLQPPVETTAVPDTTPPLVVDSSIADTTVPPVETTAAPETTSAPPTTVAPKDLVLTTDGALFGAGTDRRLWDDAVGCDSIATRSDAASACDRFSLGGVNIAWLIDANGGATVLQNDPGSDEPGTWNVELDTSSTPSRAPLVTDVTGDGQAELVFGFRTDTSLAVDVVEIRDGNAGVVLHLDLPNGRATAGDGQLDVWQRGNGDGFEHWTIRRDGGRWTKDGFERTSSPPAGNF
jgi:hypothetical protein